MPAGPVPAAKMALEDAGISIKEMKVDGGAVVNELLMQFQADLLGIPVQRPVVAETTALGAAYLAGLAVGYWDGFDEIQTQWAVEKRFEPQMASETVDGLIHQWNRAVGRTKHWLKDA